MGMNYYYYVGTFLKVKAKIDLDEIFDDADTLTYGRGELHDENNITYLIPNRKINGIDRSDTYSEYGNNLGVQSFEPEDITEEIRLFCVQFADELSKLREVTEFTIEWGVVPNCS